MALSLKTAHRDQRGRGDEAATAGLKIGRPLAAFDEAEYRGQVADLVGQSQGARMDLAASNSLRVGVDAIDEKLKKRP